MTKNIKCKTPIIILSIVALVCTAISCITYFLYYDYEYVSGGNSYYELTAEFPDIISLLFLMLDIAPYILLFIYLIKFCEQYRATILYPIVCGLIAGYPLLSTIYDIVLGYGFYGILYTIIDVAIIVSFALLTINAIKGLNKKVYTIIAVSIGCASQLWYMISFLTNISWYIEDEMYLYLFTSPIGYIGTIALYIALLLFGLNNRIPALVSVSPEQEKKRAEKMTPEQSLRFLKDKLDLGMITEEEYQTQRAEIISKL